MGWSRKNLIYLFIYLFVIFIAGTVYIIKMEKSLFFFLDQNAEVKQKLGASEKEKEVCFLEKT